MEQKSEVIPAGGIAGLCLGLLRSNPATAGLLRFCRVFHVAHGRWNHGLEHP